MFPLAIHNTLIVSDVHLGSHVCRANALLDTLRRKPTIISSSLAISLMI